MIPQGVRRRLPAALLLLTAAAAFAPALDGAFLRWDDDRLARENPLVADPSWANLGRIFSAPQNEAYQPLSTASYYVDRLVFGFRPAGSHLLNLALYLGALALLYRFLRRLGASAWVAAAGLALFALHPARVESVAWISGRKDLLSLLLVAVALLWHARSERPFDRAHWLSVGAFALAALSKTTVLFLPLFLPLLDRWALRRPRRSALLRAAPSAALAGGLALLVFHLWRSGGLTRPLAEAGSRFALAPKTLLHYAATTVMPFDLSPLYPIDCAGLFDGRAAAGLVLLAGLLALILAARRAAPGVALGTALFLLALLPVANLVPMVFQVNDRYLLLPGLGLALGVWGAAGALDPHPRLRTALLLLVGLGALTGGALSFRYAFAWRSDPALWEHAVRAQPDSDYAWMKLGETYRDRGRFEEASAAYDEAVARAPGLLPARGGRLLNCLVRVDAGRHGRPVEAAHALEPLAGPYLAAGGEALALFEVGRALYAARFDDCAFDVFLEAARAKPPLSDDRLLHLVRDWQMVGRSDFARRLLAEVSAGGRTSPLYSDVQAEVEAGASYH